MDKNKTIFQITGEIDIFLKKNGIVEREDLEEFHALLREYIQIMCFHLIKNPDKTI